MFLAGVTTVTVINTSGVLDAGLSAVRYSLLTATNPSIPEGAFGTTLRLTATQAAARTALGVLGPTDKRQTVQSSSVDANGLPNFLATAVTLNLPISATATPLRVSAAGGYDSLGQVDRFGSQTTDTTLLLAASSTLYVYADVSAAGVLTYGSGTLAPSYIYGGTPSVTNGQFTFDITKKIGYVGNGSAAVQSYRVYLGEAVTSGTAVTSVVNYALNGDYVQPLSATLPSGSTATTITHNIGVTPRNANLALVCKVAELGFSIGDVFQDPATGQTGAAWSKISSVNSAKTSVFGTSNGNQFLVLNKTAPAAFVPPTAASWYYQLTANRGW